MAPRLLLNQSTFVCMIAMLVLACTQTLASTISLTENVRHAGANLNSEEGFLAVSGLNDIVLPLSFAINSGARPSDTNRYSLVEAPSNLDSPPALDKTIFISRNAVALNDPTVISLALTPDIAVTDLKQAALNSSPIPASIPLFATVSAN